MTKKSFEVLDIIVTQLNETTTVLDPSGSKDDEHILKHKIQVSKNGKSTVFDYYGSIENYKKKIKKTISERELVYVTYRFISSAVRHLELKNKGIRGYMAGFTIPIDKKTASRLRKSDEVAFNKMKIIGVKTKDQLYVILEAMRQSYPHYL